MPQIIDVSDLPEPLVQAIETMIRSYRQRPPLDTSSPRPLGWAKNQLPELPDSFFDPLPDELLDLFDGKRP
jgi:hypothetical protein